MCHDNIRMWSATTHKQNKWRLNRVITIRNLDLRLIKEKTLNGESNCLIVNDKKYNLTMCEHNEISLLMLTYQYDLDSLKNAIEFLLHIKINIKEEK